MMALGQNGFKPNITDILDEQAELIVQIVAKVSSAGRTRVEVTEQAATAWVAEVRELAGARRPYLETCTPGYYTGEGDIDKGLLVDTYAPGPIAFTKVLTTWREGGMPGLEIS